MSDPKPMRNGIVDVILDNHNDFNTRTPNDTTLIPSGSSNSTTDPPSTIPHAAAVVHPPFTLPDGRMIDGKNTLQSFIAIIPPRMQQQQQHYDVASTTLMKPPVLTPSAPSPLVGLVVDTTGTQDALNAHKQDMNADNTTRNIGTTDIRDFNNISAVADTFINGNNTDRHRISNNEEMAAVPAEAVVVRSLALVDAELAESRLEPLELVQPSKRGTAFWIAIVLAIITTSVVTAAGVYCGTGNCGTSTSSTGTSNTYSKSNSSDENAVGDNGQAPTDELVVACNFLSFTTLTECQAEPRFDGRIVGGKIPTEIGWLTQMTHLDISYNFLSGTIPSTLGSLLHLNYLDLSSDALTGTVPSALGKLTHLSYLDLRFNALTGTIPSALRNLTRLENLYLSNNIQLGGTLPSSLCSIPVAIDFRIDCDNIECTCCTDGTSYMKCN